MPPQLPQTQIDLLRERERASFPTRAMTYFLFGEQRTLRLEELRAHLAADPVFTTADKMYLPRERQYIRSLEKAKAAILLKKRLRLSEPDYQMMLDQISDALPTRLHDNLFLPTLRQQCAPEQADWVAKAENYEILGCYAQTELGHGSNIRALETTATFIPETDEFEIHSPSLTSLKWWPGALARTSNFAAVFAQLIIAGKNYGLHSFLVQIRDFENHRPMPGCEMGDFGPKLSFNTIDNGYLRLTHVRIPRTQMLMRFSRVDAKGNYSRPPHDKMAYGTMVIVRVGLVNNSAVDMARAATIAIRYSAVRRQGGADDAPADGAVVKQEKQILDHVLQSYRLLNWLAAAYALHFASEYMFKLHGEMQSAFEKGDFSMLPEVHAVSSGMKMISSEVASAGIEDCRRACGGHGYSMNSGLPELGGTNVQYVTVEGDNYMISFQTSRFVLKSLEVAARGGKLAPSVAFLADYVQTAASSKSGGARPKLNASNVQDLLRSDVQLAAFRYRTGRLVETIARQLAQLQKQNHPSPMDSLLIELHHLAVAFMQLLVVQAFVSGLERAAADAKHANTLFPVLKSLCDLYSLSLMKSELADFLVDGYVSAEQAAWIPNAIKDLLVRIRPDAVALVDAFNFTNENLLHSALGRDDGRVYQALYEMALRNPLNPSSLHPDVVGKHLLQDITKGRL